MEAIAPEPSEAVRQAILEAISAEAREACEQPGGWAAAALAEGADADADE